MPYMDEATVKVLALLQARLQVQLGSLAVALQHPVPHEPFGEQWGRLSRSVPFPALVRQAETGAKQIRLMAEVFETKDPARLAEIAREFAVLDELIRTGLDGLWSVPPRPTT